MAFQFENASDQMYEVRFMSLCKNQASMESKTFPVNLIQVFPKTSKNFMATPIPQIACHLRLEKPALFIGLFQCF